MMPEISDWRRLIDAAEDAVGLPVRLIWMYKVLIRSTFYYVTTQVTVPLQWSLESENEIMISVRMD